MIADGVYEAKMAGIRRSHDLVGSRFDADPQKRRKVYHSFVAAVAVVE